MEKKKNEEVAQNHWTTEVATLVSLLSTDSIQVFLLVQAISELDNLS